ncbi:MAG: 50S ribosomal protein L11 methyltransferase [Caldimicrobium sp.]|nr:50S ribosomal protein L11 methyltransferase [Caldimicrobium sp.]MCX7613304.1 50S ribosomal protein L11 methyltransferase [Caldimicrobium sp.]MDW8183415.1 50S ribosomal protein L11 methyltransferase [Caldimicrobium sp.]
MLRPPYQRYETFYIYAFKSGHPELRDLEDPDLIGYWEEDGIGVLFFHKPKEELIAQLVNKLNLILEIRDIIPYSQWNERRTPKPFEVGPFKIAPLWEEGVYDLIFDPSVVFGEGTHPTTSIVLDVSWDFYKERGLPQGVWDLGCGSGILTLFWAKLGAKVFSVDINPLCIKVTKRNLELNNLKATIWEGDLRKFPSFDGELILANLYKGLLLDLFKNPRFFNPKYHIISGFTIGMEEEIIHALRDKPVKIERRVERDNWVGYLLCQI